MTSCCALVAVGTGTSFLAILRSPERGILAHGGRVLLCARRLARIHCGNSSSKRDWFAMGNWAWWKWKSMYDANVQRSFQNHASAANTSWPDFARTFGLAHHPSFGDSWNYDKLQRAGHTGNLTLSQVMEDTMLATSGVPPSLSFVGFADEFADEFVPWCVCVSSLPQRLDGEGAAVCALPNTIYAFGDGQLTAGASRQPLVL